MKNRKSIKFKKTRNNHNSRRNTISLKAGFVVCCANTIRVQHNGSSQFLSEGRIQVVQPIFSVRTRKLDVLVRGVFSGQREGGSDGEDDMI